jgi:hypothetical protein
MRGSQLKYAESQPAKPRKTMTYAEQLQSLQPPKDVYYETPGKNLFVSTGLINSAVGQ